MEEKNNISEEQLSDYENKMAQVIGNIVGYLRELSKERSMDFVLFRLDEIAKESMMEDSPKKCIITTIENPDKPFSIQFKPN